MANPTRPMSRLSLQALTVLADRYPVRYSGDVAESIRAWRREAGEHVPGLRGPWTSSVTRALKVLAARGLVTIRGNAEWGYQWRITEAGREKLREVSDGA